MLPNELLPPRNFRLDQSAERFRFARDSLSALCGKLLHDQRRRQRLVRFVSETLDDRGSSLSGGKQREPIGNFEARDTGLRHRRYRTAAVDLGPQPADVPAARRFLARHLRRWGCADRLDDGPGPARLSGRRRRPVGTDLEEWGP